MDENKGIVQMMLQSNQPCDHGWNGRGCGNDHKPVGCRIRFDLEESSQRVIDERRPKKDDGEVENHDMVLTYIHISFY